MKNCDIIISKFNKIKSLKTEKIQIQNKLDDIEDEIHNENSSILSQLKGIINTMSSVEESQTKVIIPLNSKDKPISDISYYGDYTINSIRKKDDLLIVRYNHYTDGRCGEHTSYHLVKIPLSYFNLSLIEVKKLHEIWVINKIKFLNEEILKRKTESLHLKVEEDKKAEIDLYLTLKNKYERS